MAIYLIPLLALCLSAFAQENSTSTVQCYQYTGRNRDLLVNACQKLQPPCKSNERCALQPNKQTGCMEVVCLSIESSGIKNFANSAGGSAEESTDCVVPSHCRVPCIGTGGVCTPKAKEGWTPDQGTPCYWNVCTYPN